MPRPSLPGFLLRSFSRRALNRFGLVMLAAALLALPQLEAGEYNTVLDIGDPAPAWEKLPGTDGTLHALKDLADKKVVVVAFTCNSCPYAVDYENRLIAFQEKYCGPGKPVALVAINVNKIDEDRLEAMKTRAEEKGFNFPYLFDESQQIARKFGAFRTPELYVLDNERRVVYMGAMDDNTDAAKVTKHYVEDAVEAALAGKAPQVKETPPVGCSIRFERERRTRRK